MAVEVGVPDGVFDEGLWKGLALLLEGLESDLRERVVVHAHGHLTAKDRARLHALGARLGPACGHDGDTGSGCVS
ncbi:hypothetical protein ACFQ51_53535 [Streptomyces kaempferi]